MVFSFRYAFYNSIIYSYSGQLYENSFKTKSVVGILDEFNYFKCSSILFKRRIYFGIH